MDNLFLIEAKYMEKYPDLKPLLYAWNGSINTKDSISHRTNNKKTYLVRWPRTLKNDTHDNLHTCGCYCYVSPDSNQSKKICYFFLYWYYDCYYFNDWALAMDKYKKKSWFSVAFFSRFNIIHLRIETEVGRPAKSFESRIRYFYFILFSFLNGSGEIWSKWPLPFKFYGLSMEKCCARLFFFLSLSLVLGKKNNNRNGQMAENLFLWKLQLFFFLSRVCVLRFENGNVYIFWFYRVLNGL